MRAVLKLVSPMFAASMALIVFLYETPGDFAYALGLTQSVDLDRTAAQPISEHPAIRSFAELSGPTGATSLAEEYGCFDQPSALTASALDRCAHAIAAAVHEVSEYERSYGVDGTTEERLRLAATHVCRALWAESDGFMIDMDNPACATSTLRLASFDDPGY